MALFLDRPAAVPGAEPHRDALTAPGMFPPDLPFGILHKRFDGERSDLIEEVSLDGISRAHEPARLRLQRFSEGGKDDEGIGGSGEVRGEGGSGEEGSVDDDDAVVPREYLPAGSGDAGPCEAFGKGERLGCMAADRLVAARRSDVLVAIELFADRRPIYRRASDGDRLRRGGRS